jgi:uncharacterized protein
MKSIYQFVRKWPLLFSLFVVVITMLASEIPLEGLFLSFLSSQAAGYLQGIILQGVLGVALVALVYRLGWAKLCGLETPKNWKDLWLCWPFILLILFCALPLPANIDTTRPLTILLFVVVFLTTGLFEESLFRGVVLSSYLQKWGASKRGIYGAVLLSSLFFTLVHIPDLIKEGTFSAVAAYLLPNFFCGVFYAAYTLRTRSMWMTMLLHGLVDIAQNLSVLSAGSQLELSRLNETSIDWMGVLLSFLVTLPLFLYSLYILRKVKVVNRGLE